jgi:hypothetical protein
MVGQVPIGIASCWIDGLVCYIAVACWAEIAAMAVIFPTRNAASAVDWLGIINSTISLT